MAYKGWYAIKHKQSAIKYLAFWFQVCNTDNFQYMGPVG